MKITDIQIYKTSSAKIVANAVVTFDDEVTVKDIKIVNGATGLFVGLPSREYIDKEGNKKYANIVEFNKAVENELKSKIIDAYEGKGGGAKSGATAKSSVPASYRQQAAASTKTTKPSPVKTVQEPSDEWGDEF
jgi:DNA-binding cell septation regulator SpoVG